MSIFTHEQTALQAVPLPVRTAPAAEPDQDNFKSAYDACKAHPAYREAVVIRDAIESLRALCDEFTERYHPDTIRVYLRGEGFRTSDLCEDFETVHRDVLGAVWFLDIIRSGIEPALILPMDLRSTPPVASAKGEAA
ncbi:hypothetical protein GobsT_23230 [Gemmata obscuriglobus]|uniref:Uncharacterized protein n=1 Tax=Gemmata obscuriglobus TaxID=114 RepID=A0A2Z3H4W1_9BACT|nr:hypothetical protein [Gemmata obscuriglobus]AWM39362.1 hypothetical protein C1280_21825 [Gemmata obscuriglobus]QEG27567.1 hypothetical protein GobsT_23230 [Gemmata obscuriglobus]VTS04655.1 unnamed protein product [Gemmata obscuriglobus UQM 2246]